MNSEIRTLITRKIVEQYEIIRRAGACNMANYRCVNGEAWLHHFDELADLTKEEYSILLENYGELMEHYQIEER